jgi:hypothetical protein
MQLFMTALAVIAGMTFSLTIALCVEEVVFGKYFALCSGKPQPIGICTAIGSNEVWIATLKREENKVCCS